MYSPRGREASWRWNARELGPPSTFCTISYAAGLLIHTCINELSTRLSQRSAPLGLPQLSVMAQMMSSVCSGTLPGTSLSRSASLSVASSVSSTGAACCRSSGMSSAMRFLRNASSSAASVTPTAASVSRSTFFRCLSALCDFVHSAHRGSPPQRRMRQRGERSWASWLLTLRPKTDTSSNWPGFGTPPQIAPSPRRSKRSRNPTPAPAAAPS
mmetsp:Transcript_16446/g.51114  ORF Transcript_16446/g.51114 Transcript_16446/m.51114 type:complete len:213 (+) Transcript_16446:1343-1981(+)